MLRRAAGVNLKGGLERTDRALTVAQELEDANAHRVAEHPKEVGLDAVNRLGTSVRDNGGELAHG